jgi:hypothetical protein
VARQGAAVAWPACHPRHRAGPHRGRPQTSFRLRVQGTDRQSTEPLGGALRVGQPRRRDFGASRRAGAGRSNRDRLPAHPGGTPLRPVSTRRPGTTTPSCASTPSRAKRPSDSPPAWGIPATTPTATPSPRPEVRSCLPRGVP